MLIILIIRLKLYMVNFSIEDYLKEINVKIIIFFFYSKYGKIFKIFI